MEDPEKKSPSPSSSPSPSPSPSQINSRKSESESESESDSAEFRRFESFLKWICIMDHSNPFTATLSCFLFSAFAIAVPIASHFALSCSDCDEDHRSSVCLSAWLRHLGLSRFLFLDKLCESSHKARDEYSKQLKRSMELISFFLLPCFMAEAAYKIWWYVSAANEIPYYGNMYLSYITSCTLELFSWLYRTSIFFFVCILFRLVCRLQMIRLEDFVSVFHRESDVGTILMQHLGLRRTLTIISHRFRVFMFLSLILVTASQFISLLMTTRSHALANLSKTGQLALCSISLVTGLFICLRSAAKITHKAQSITCLAAKWHVSAAINTFDDLDNETPTASVIAAFEFNSDDDEEDDEDDEDDMKLMPVFAHTISFQKRQALVTYLRNNKGGITVYGFVVDRTWLKSVFAIELALMLWLLNKTVGIS
ncbi:uncharacterized protein LOC111788411 [Cucurbita pepo subsp. pepo]|uniref:uncharacterized protein LOC111788411 n=1 Tax=Cucurbita pepo subsp. pepo TaxID=3664 RepID=UPI000C9D4BC2|nr:uncharacterized protein LOC111788411 [Cucurbita pepo subsp. pepo]